MERFRENKKLIERLEIEKAQNLLDFEYSIYELLKDISKSLAIIAYECEPVCMKYGNIDVDEYIERQEKEEERGLENEG